MRKTNVTVVFGTRPEIIKLAPIILNLTDEKSVNLNTVYVTQHGKVVEEILKIFKITKYSICEVNRENETLIELSAKLIENLTHHINRNNTDILIIQGDTTTALCAAYVAFLNQIQIYHIEAGLRTFDNLNPFPEEVNRRLISVMSSFHFAPTDKAKKNLLREGISEDRIKVIGNTVIDAALKIQKYNRVKFLKYIEVFLKNYPKFILVTCHRRENWETGLDQLMEGIFKFASAENSIGIIFVTHLNPKLQNKVKHKFKTLANVSVLPPLNYAEFQRLLSMTELVITDSGGIQEEAPVYGKFSLVARNATERIESQEQGYSDILMDDPVAISAQISDVMDKINLNKLNIKLIYGDGNSSQRVVDFILKNECDEIS